MERIEIEEAGAPEKQRTRPRTNPNWHPHPPASGRCGSQAGMRGLAATPPHKQNNEVGVSTYPNFVVLFVSGGVGCLVAARKHFSFLDFSKEKKNDGDHQVSDRWVSGEVW